MSVTCHLCVETLASLIIALRGKGLFYQKSRVLVNGIEAPNKESGRRCPFQWAQAQRAGASYG